MKSLREHLEAIYDEVESRCVKLEIDVDFYQRQILTDVAMPKEAQQVYEKEAMISKKSLEYSRKLLKFIGERLEKELKKEKGIGES